MRWGTQITILGALLVSLANHASAALIPEDGYSVAWLLAACKSTDKTTYEKKCEQPLDLYYLQALDMHEHVTTGVPFALHPISRAMRQAI